MRRIVASVSLILTLGAAPISAAGVTPAVCGQLLSRASQEMAALGGRLSARFDGVGPNADACVFGDLALIGGMRDPDISADSLRLSGGILGWGLTSGPMPTDVAAEATGVILTPKTGKSAGPIMLGDLDLAARWAPEARRLDIGFLDLRMPGGDRLQLSANVSNVDLTTAAAAQMSMAGFAVNQLDMTALNKGALDPVIVALLAGAADQGAKTRLKRDIQDLPADAFPLASRRALGALVDDMPRPRGALRLSMRSDAGFGPARFAVFALTGWPRSIADAAPVFSGTRFDLDWRPGADN